MLKTQVERMALGGMISKTKRSQMSSLDLETQLKDLYAKMYEFTKNECSSKCILPHSCCSPEYCAMAIDLAKKNWGETLAPTSQFLDKKTKLPLMGDKGCVAAPHLRPLCTLHTCAINNMATSGDRRWDKEYFKIRAAIDKLELKRYYSKE